MERAAIAMVLTALVVLPPKASQAPPVLSAAAVAAERVAIVAANPPSKSPAPRADFGLASASTAVRQLADQVLADGDNAHRPFVVIDKQAARLFVVSAEGRLVGDTPVLLGAAVGDDSVPGIGERPIAAIRPFERTTPAGRFNARAGRNAQGEDIVWVDYDAAISMHRVRTTNPRERRLERLASPIVAERRISYGCINMPAAFFDRVVGPLFAAGPHMVYILPERKSVPQVFAGIGKKPAG